jgi:hypothetical protein
MNFVILHVHETLGARDGTVKCGNSFSESSGRILKRELKDSHADGDGLAIAAPGHIATPVFQSTKPVDADENSQSRGGVRITQRAFGALLATAAT